VTFSYFVLFYSILLPFRIVAMQREVNLKLRAARVLRGLTQGDLGNKIDRSQTWVCELERGLVEPSDLDVALICRVLGAKPGDIFPQEVNDE